MSAARTDYRSALEAVERILNRGGDPDDVLRAVLETLHARGIGFARVRFAAAGGLMEGPAVGEPTDALETPVVLGGATVGALELAVDDRPFAMRVATLISPYVRSARNARG